MSFVIQYTLNDDGQVATVTASQYSVAHDLYRLLAESARVTWARYYDEEHPGHLIGERVTARARRGP